MADKKEFVPSEVCQKVLDVLKNASEPMTLDQINAKLGEDGLVKPGHVSTLKKQGLITADKVTVEYTASKEVNAYSIVK